VRILTRRRPASRHQLPAAPARAALDSRGLCAVLTCDQPGTVGTGHGRDTVLTCPGHTPAGRGR
jgi:hypothetical protein